MAWRMKRPEEHRIELEDDNWILVKQWLTAGESRQMFGRTVVKWTGAGEKPELNPLEGGLSQMIEYLLDWSVTDADGRPIRIRGRSAEERAAIFNELPLEIYNPINVAVNAHIVAMEERLAEEKKMAGIAESPAISGSVA